MKPELKQRWIEALRSDQYKQGQAFLRRKDCFCCLGVLCDLVAPNGWLPSDEVGSGVFSHGPKYQDCFPCATVLEEIAVGDADLFHLRDYTGPLWMASHLNDAGKTFLEIADYLQQDPSL